MVQREVFLLSFVGLAAGISFAWGTARYLASFLFGVRPNDLVVFGLSAVILITCALAASCAAAWRAARIDPMEALPERIATALGYIIPTIERAMSSFRKPQSSRRDPWIRESPIEGDF
jgi:hypothetical protein